MKWDSASIKFDGKNDPPKLDFTNTTKKYCYECICGTRVYVSKEPEETKRKQDDLRKKFGGPCGDESIPCNVDSPHITQYE